jgi:4'-phosphopantetheinyl transferase
MAARTFLQQWGTAPDEMSLQSREVHVWRADLRVIPAEMEELFGTLSSGERARAATFKFPRDQERFMVSRGILRQVLARYLHQSASELHLCNGPFGKPALSDVPGVEALQFNLSHSHNLAVFAVARREEIGIDLERVEPFPAGDLVSRRSFTRDEVRFLRAVSQDRQLEEFFGSWTRKEAYLKARGEGLSLRIDTLSVPTSSAGSVTFFDRGASVWSMHTFKPALGYVAALAVHGIPGKLKFWEWKSSSAKVFPSPQGGGLFFRPDESPDQDAIVER